MDRLPAANYQSQANLQCAKRMNRYIYRLQVFIAQSCYRVNKTNGATGACICLIYYMGYSSGKGEEAMVDLFFSMPLKFSNRNVQIFIIRQNQNPSLFCSFSTSLKVDLPHSGWSSNATHFLVYILLAFIIIWGIILIPGLPCLMSVQPFLDETQQLSFLQMHISCV